MSRHPAQPFGLKLDTTLAASTRSTLSNATITGPAGAPAGLSVTFTGQPNDGEKLVFQLRMPDGSMKEVTLTANTSVGAAATADGFQIGATATDTANNLRAALDLMSRRETDSTLRAASALEVAKDLLRRAPTRFGNYYPQRIAAPVTGGLDWLRGGWGTAHGRLLQGRGYAPDRSCADIRQRDPQPGLLAHRGGGQCRVGIRANEEAFGDMLASLAVFAIEDFTLPGRADGGTAVIVRQRYEQLLPAPAL